MRVLMGMTAVVSFLGLPFITFIPYFAKIQLHAGESGLGWLLACSGTGSVLGAVTIAVLGNIRRRGIVRHGGRRGVFRGHHGFQRVASICVLGNSLPSSKASAGSS